MRSLLQKWFKNDADRDPETLDTPFQVPDNLLKPNTPLGLLGETMKGYGVSGETAQKVEKAFELMGLPVPDDNDQFVRGREGILLFDDAHGVVVRIEYTDQGRSGYDLMRANDSAWVVQPLATVDAGEMLIEICPGFKPETDGERVEQLKGLMAHEGYNFADAGLRNMGRMPISTPTFPDGVPMSIDRAVVNKLEEGLRPVVDKIVDLVRKEVMNAQRELYAPVRREFAQGWPKPEKMKDFWKKCRDFVQEGKCAAGWNDPAAWKAHENRRYGGDRTAREKTMKASSSAKKYAARRDAGNGGPHL
ncbi:MAG: hypothetical protein OXT65_05105 [Alphaproteobacteria bacterium]|nr:hypothetical protein [Alphaproteobacteria bacterium]